MSYTLKNRILLTLGQAGKVSAKEQAEELLMVPGGCAEGKEERQILLAFFGCSNHNLCIRIQHKKLSISKVKVVVR